MKPNDIEFLMHAINCLNSPNMEVVKSFRQNKDSVKRLAELAGTNRDVLEVIDKLKGAIK